MNAILHSQYGASDVLQLKEIDKPAPKDTVLIAIHATTVSTADCNMRNVTFVTNSMLPIAKLMFGIGRPWKARVLGTELSGEVERVGKDVTRFTTGSRAHRPLALKTVSRVNGLAMLTSYDRGHERPPDVVTVSPLRRR